MRGLRGLTLATLASAVLCGHCVQEFRCDIPAKCGMSPDGGSPIDASPVEETSLPAHDRWDAGGATEGDAPDDAVLAPASGLDCDVDVVEPSASCAPRDEVGVFVSPQGSDSAAGSRGHPLATLQRAFQVAQQTGKLHIYACASKGPFRDPVSVRLDGAVLHGGVDCDTWLHTRDAVTSVETQGAAVPLRVESIATSFAVVDFAFTAADQTIVGSSSIAAFVAQSVGVHFTHVTFVAGDGMHGADATEADATSNYTDMGTPDERLRGYSAADVPEPHTQECKGICVTVDEGLQTTGGRAGSTRTGGAPATIAGDGTPSYGNGPPGAGQHGENFNAANKTPCTPGQPGMDGPAGCGGTGSRRPGELTATEWRPERGGTGNTGAPGQGGGGGGAPAVGAGGGGACGGCGGAGGLGGGGGGASFALVSYKSNIVLERCRLLAHSGGRGGKGGPGQVGQLGGVGGNGGGTNPSSSRGGNGGRGGRGGLGGGGAGGLAAAIAYVGALPGFSDLDSSLEVSGRGGAGGEPGSLGVDGRPDAGDRLTESVGMDASGDAKGDSDAFERPGAQGDAAEDGPSGVDGGDEVDGASFADEGAVGLVTPVEPEAEPESCPAARGLDGVEQRVLLVEGT